MGSDRLYQEFFKKLKMSEGKRVLIVLPDERRLELLVQPNLLSSDLLDLVTSQVALKEKEFFGLAYVDETGHFSWLQYDRRVLDHEFPKKSALPLGSSHQSIHQAGKCAIVLYFLIKFYVESISLLRDCHTVEHFYLQLRSMVFKDQLEVGTDTVHTLAALALQAAHGDYVDDATARNQLKKSPVLPASALKQHHSLAECEERVIEIYKSLAGQTRGQVIVNYLSKVEALPNYGVHYYAVTDKRHTPWYLGISYKGIAQYDYADRRHPRRVFLWKQLENLYFRDRKFSIEVHDPKRLHAGSNSLHAYRESHDSLEEDAGLSESPNNEEADTSSSAGRRGLQSGTISVIVWFGQTQALTKNIWHMAICQHQFYLDRRNSKSRQLKARNLNDIAVDLSKSSTSLSLSTASSQSNLSHSGSTLSLNGKMGQTPETEESEAARAARMEIVAALKSRKAAMEEKLKAKIEELKKICLEEGALSGQLPPEYPVGPGEAPPTIRRRVGTAFTLPEYLLNKAKCSKEESLAALELEYEIQRKITSAALRLSNDSSPSKSVKRQRKMIYQQSLQQLKDIEAKLRALRLAEMYNSTQAQPQVPVTNSPWNKAKKKPRPNGSTDPSPDEEGGFNQTENSIDPGDLYLDDPGVNLSPAGPQQPKQQQQQQCAPVNHHRPITTTPMRRDRSLSPSSVPPGSRPETQARSAPASPQKIRPALNYANYGNGHYNSHHSHHHHNHHNHNNFQQQHSEPRRNQDRSYGSNAPVMRSSYRDKQFTSLNGHTPPSYVIKDMSWDHQHHSGTSNNRTGVPSTALHPPLVGVDPSAGGGLYNIARQRASHDFPGHTSVDDLEVIGLRRLTCADPSMMPPGQHSPAQESNPNTSADFEWDFGDDSTPATRRLDQLVSQHRFGSLDRRRRLMNASVDADSKPNLRTVQDASRSLDELDGPSPLTVDVIDGSSIGPRFGGRGLRKASSSSSNQSSNFNEPELTLLPNQTYPDYPDFGASIRDRSGSASRMETVFDVDSAVYTRMSNNVSTTSLHSNKKKEKDWYETSLDSPVPARKPKPSGPVGEKPATIRAMTPTAPSSSSSTSPMTNGTSTVRAQPVRLADHDREDDFEFETVVPYESPKNLEIIAPGKFEPYREVIKPFETSDIYKYSAKYRQQQQQQQQQAKGLYQPLTPLTCQPLNQTNGNSVNPHLNYTRNTDDGHSHLHSNPPAPEYRSKPATLV